MKEILSATLFALLGVAAVRFLPKFLKQNKQNNNNSNNENMSRQEDFRQCRYSNCSMEDSSQIDESKPSPIAMIYKSEMDYISRCILDYPNIETGGQLFGFWTTEGVPVVLYAIGPGPRSEHHSVHFIQDPDYLGRIGGILINKYGLQHIGEWHSHHQLGLAKPSGQDSCNMFHVLERYNFRHFLLCIGNCTPTSSTLNAFSFHINNLHDYIQAKWDIKDLNSPFRAIIDEELNDLLIQPHCQQASIGELYTVNHRTASVLPGYGSDYWLNIKENNKILKAIIDYITIQEGFNVNIKMDTDRIVHLFLNKPGIQQHIVFPERFPYTAPLIESVVDNEEYIDRKDNTPPSWEFNGDIYSSFINFYKSY